jgi:pimeloyl-ACP methyl ester carboxylesterase
MQSERMIRIEKVDIATGPRLNCVRSGDPSGEPVVFIHGWPDSWFSYSRILPLLPLTFHAITYDQRGFGDSDRPASAYTIAEMAGDVIALLDVLNIERATLVGHSFGSFVARQVTLAHPDRVAALALIGTGFTGANAVTRDLQSSLRDLPDPIPLEFARDFGNSTLYLPVPAEFFDRMVADSMKLPPRLWRLTMDRLVEYDDTETLAQIKVPTLLLWGDRDALFSRAEQDRFLERLPSARLKVYPETGHCPNWERPELVAADITHFVLNR